MKTNLHPIKKLKKATISPTPFVPTGKGKPYCRLVSFILLLCLFCSSMMLATAARGSGEFRYANLRLCPGGVPFGVKFVTDGVLIVRIDKDTAASGVLYPGDRVTAVDGKTVKTAAELSDAVNAGGGKPITISYRHGNTDRQLTLTPHYDTTDGRYKTGLFVRDSGAGIGTVTFLRKEDNAFGGLGHGICDTESGKLIPMNRGSVSNVTVNGLTKGVSGTPGELKGYFTSGKIGTLLSNTECGVFGIFTAPPAGMQAESVAVAAKEEIREGEATIRCTLGDDGVREYKAEISAIRLDATGPKCFTVKITDPALLARSGGIVQGMSGSPILQNGKLVGAVTHVMVSDPSVGYGIFIENMLDRMEQTLQ